MWVSKYVRIAPNKLILTNNNNNNNRTADNVDKSYDIIQ